MNLHFVTGTDEVDLCSVIACGDNQKDHGYSEKSENKISEGSPVYQLEFCKNEMWSITGYSDRNKWLEWMMYTARQSNLSNCIECAKARSHLEIKQSL